VPFPRPALLLLLLPAAAYAAGPTGAVVGTVLDPSGRAIPNATVTVRNEETGVTRQISGGELGDYSAPLLTPGLYQISVESTNFRKAVRTGVRVEVNETERVDFQLALGDLNQEVTVTGDAPLVQADTTTVGFVVDRRQIAELPLNERNFLSFTLLVPGSQLPADGSQNSTLGASVSVNGAREQSNNFMLDGVDNNDSLINTYSSLPSVDAIQEFQVQGANSSAEFGRSGGAQINVVLKSGTNTAHGSLFEFFRNRHLDAKNFFDLPGCTPGAVPGSCSDIPRFDRNQFGGMLGGPVRRNKTFYLVSYEGLRLRQAITRESTVPSQVQRSAALAGVPAAARNPAGMAILNLYPAANVGPGLNTSNRYLGVGNLSNRLDQFLLKGDHVLGPRDQVSGHYSFFDESRYNPYDPFVAFTSLPGYGSFYDNRGQNARLTWTHTTGSRAVNESRIGYNRLSAGSTQQSRGVSHAAQLGFTEVAADPKTQGYPEVVVAGFDGIGEPINTPQARHNNTIQVADTFAWNPRFWNGRHRLKFGGELRLVRLNMFLNLFARGEYQFLGVATGDPLKDLLLGFPTYAIGVSGDPYASMRTLAQNYFFQDDIRLHPRLTLNVGLRYEFNSPPVEAHDRLSLPDLRPQAITCAPQPDCLFLRGGTGNVPRATFAADKNNFAPRIGLAWRPGAGNGLVIRSAYGIFYDVNILNLNVAAHFNPPFFKAGLYPNFGTSNIQNIIGPAAYPTPPLANFISPAFRDGYMQDWNAGVQYEFLPNTVLDVAYVGSKGVKLADKRNPNQPQPGGTNPYPAFGAWTFWESASSSSYHSLQVRGERRGTAGLTMRLAYTWSRSIDDASGLFQSASEPAFPQNSQDMRAERALSNFHAEHRFVASHIYDLPLGPGRRWMRERNVASTILGDWQVSGIWTFQSGRPFTVNRAIDQSNTGTYILAPSDRPDQISDPTRPGAVAANPDPACHTTVSQGGRASDQVAVPNAWFNPCAFAAAPGRFGTAGRNSLIGPALLNVDVALVKHIPLRSDKRTLQLRMEFFNLLNHPNFDVPDRMFDSPTFSSVRSANVWGNKPPRQTQLALKYVF
jgi:hypothetical protein